MKLQQSLVMKLTLLISLGLFIIWLISVFISAYVSLSQVRKKTMENLSQFATLRVELSNHRFAGAEKDAQLLANRYQLYHDAPLKSPLLEQTESYYFPLSHSIYAPQTRREQDLNFIQTYGTAGQTYYLDSFILDRRFGISLLPPLDGSANYFSHRRFGLDHFPSQPTHDNLFWGKPEYISGSGWSVSVAAADTQGVLTGLAVKLNDLMAYGQPISGCDISLWLNSDNQILPFSSLPANLAHTLPLLLQHTTLHDGWQKIPGYLVLRTQLKGPGWQQVLLYPTHQITEQAISIVVGQLPFALTTLLLLAAMLLGLLHRYLARPLWDFVAIIGKTGPQSLTVRLPENRQDELGSIARAYNLLLDTLRAQYDDLEHKVAERTQALSEAKQQAEQANKRKSLHLTTISHELRTPLSGALGAIELLQTTAMETRQSQLADTAQQCTLSLLAIINNLLDFSRIEAGQLALHIEEIALLPLLDQAMQTIQGPAHAKGLSLKTFVGDQVPLHLDTDGIRLRQILVNLLGNALKFTEKGGICLSVKRQGSLLIFAVSDSGQGIAPADHNHIFTPFFQAKNHLQGTGLGLTIAANLAALMQGALKLDSTLGLGTCISLQLPLHHYQAPTPIHGRLAAPLALHLQLSAWGIECETEQQEGPFSAAELRFLPNRLYQRVLQTLSGESTNLVEDIPVQPWRLRVLLVDDATINRDIIGMMLARLGQSVVTAPDGVQALALGHREQFDLVLMDIRMPDMDGIECTQHWRADPKNRDPDCMIMALSANTAPEEKMRCKQVGIQHYLTKPVTLAQLAEGLSLAAEHQLQRDIALQEQDPAFSTALLATHQAPMQQKIYQALVQLLEELEDKQDDQEKSADLLHTLKGCLGQAGLRTLLCSVIDMENRVRHGFRLQQEEITEFRHTIEMTFDATSETAPFFQEVKENDRP